MISCKSERIVKYIEMGMEVIDSMSMECFCGSILLTTSIDDHLTRPIHLRKIDPEQMLKCECGGLLNYKNHIRSKKHKLYIEMQKNEYLRCPCGMVFKSTYPIEKHEATLSHRKYLLGIGRGVQLPILDFRS